MTSVDQIKHDRSKETRSQRRARRRLVTQTQWAREQKLNQANEDGPVTLDQRMSLLESFGDFSIAYSTAVQPLLKYHGDPSGYIAYRKRWGVSVALGDPVIAPDKTDQILNEFICQHRHPVFCQISRNTAARLSQLGFFVNEFGVDTRLELGQYSLAGKEKEWLRYAFNWVQRRDYRIAEADFDTVTSEEVEAVSEAWRKTRTVKSKEVRFLNRPIVLENEKDVRRFFLFNPDGKIEAYVFFDPLYRDRKVIGYVTAFKRRHPDATQYSEQAIMKVAIETFKNEGVSEIRLGLSPCAWLEDQAFRSSWLTGKLFRTLYNSKTVNRYAYNLVGHAEYKRRFRGIEEQTYFASRSRFNIRTLMSLIGLCGIA